MTSCTPHAFDVVLVPDLEEGSSALLVLIVSQAILLQLRLAADSRTSSQAKLLARIPATLQPAPEAVYLVHKSQQK